jgi:hypothetical protein
MAGLSPHKTLDDFDIGFPLDWTERPVPMPEMAVVCNAAGPRKSSAVAPTLTSLVDRRPQAMSTARERQLPSRTPKARLMSGRGRS